MNVKTRKANGQGHTYKIGNSWRTVIRSGEKIITASSTNKAESRKRAKLKLQSHISGLDLAFDKPTSLTTYEYLINWLNLEHKESLAPSTYRRYDSLIRVHINPVIGNHKLTKLTKTHLSDCLALMAQHGQSQRSQQQARAILKLALRHAFESDLIKASPANSLRNIRVESSQTYPLTLKEVKILLNRFDSSYLGARLHIALICGLRQGEALGLRWSDIDLIDRTLHVRQQQQKIDGTYQLVPLKTFRSRRTIILTESTTKVLAEYKKESVSKEMVFSAPDGGTKSSHSDYSDWKRALRICGLEPRRLHDARHTAATIMYSQGIGIETISRALGHSSSAITSRLYVHNSEEPLRLAAEKISSILD